jgi:hypothetical protein
MASIDIRRNVDSGAGEVYFWELADVDEVNAERGH